MADIIRVGVLFGGRSGEHQVSLVSAGYVMDALDRAKYEVIPLGITKEGAWLAGEVMQYLKSEGREGKVERVFLVPDPTCGELLRYEGGKLPRPDVIFPVMHGPYGEDGTLQGLLEMADIPYVGAGVLSSACCMDKAFSKVLFEASGLPVVDSIEFTRTDWAEAHDEVVDDVEEALGYPVFVKPVNMGSSVGVAKAEGREALEKAVEEAFAYDRKVIIEQAVHSPREIEVSVLGNDDPVASAPGEIHPCNEFYDYDAKYVAGKTNLTIPADLPKALAEEIRELALTAYRTLDCSGMARVDFLLEGGSNDVYLSEINTIPGFTSISMYPKLWDNSGIPYPELLDRLIALAFQRHEAKKGIRTAFDPGTDWYR